jgi:hypothetical protein
MCAEEVSLVAFLDKKPTYRKWINSLESLPSREQQFPILTG